jgi:hypothetical protein
MRARLFFVCVGILVLTCFTAGAQPTPKAACPPLAGEWSGEFAGSYAGDWSATFTQSGNTIRAEATITLEAGQRFEAEGTAGSSCEGAKTALAGSGSAKERSGSFSGISDDKGRRLSGTWWSGDFAGTWEGERVDGEQAP